MRTFKDLKAGNRIIDKNNNVMEVLYWNFYGTGKIKCVADGKSIYLIDEFSPEDWKLLN